MKLLKVFDSKDYSDDMPRIVRHAVRGIIILDGKVAMTQSKYGDFKFPGGGIENQETELDTLIREVQEETGLKVVRETCKPAGEVIELRKDRFENKIFEHHSYYYFVQEIEKEIVDTNKSENEKSYGYQLKWVTLEVAYRTNMMIPEIEQKPWTFRDTWVMKEIIEKKIDI